MSFYGKYPISGGNSSSWVKYTYTYADFAAAATSKTINVVTLAAGQCLAGIFIHHTIKFQNAGDTAAAQLTLANSDGAFAFYISAWDLNTAVSGTNFVWAAPLPAGYAAAGTPSPAGGIESFSGSTVVQATLDCEPDNTNTLTAGSVDIYLNLQQVGS